MSEIAVTARAGDGGTRTFDVEVVDDDGRTRHEVTLQEGDYARWGAGAGSPEEFVRACFEFLLEREPKESILPSFDISVIPRYFPEFEVAVAARFGAG